MSFRRRASVELAPPSKRQRTANELARYVGSVTIQYAHSAGTYYALSAT